MRNLGQWNLISSGGAVSVFIKISRSFTSCPIPDVCIDERRLPLFIARATLRELIVGLKARVMGGFERKLTSSKWAKFVDCSQDAAARDIATLINLGLLRRAEACGRSTHYEIQLGEAE